MWLNPIIVALNESACCLTDAEKTMRGTTNDATATHVIAAIQSTNQAIKELISVLESEI